MRKSIENLFGRKYTGGRKVPLRGRRKYEIDRYPNEAVVGTTEMVSRRTRGNNFKFALESAEFANVSDTLSKTTKRLKIIRVIKNPANKDYERRGVISKGALFETEEGIAKVVSRPGQNGSVNAVFVRR
jgi:small subunit ribosomal protein S8e